MKNFFSAATVMLTMSAVYAQFDESRFIPFKADTPRYEKSLGQLPRGAKDFVVNAPKIPENSTTYTPKFDELKNPETFARDLSKIIKHCKDKKISVLTLPRGVYYVTDKESIVFDGLEDFVFDGGGSTFLYLKGDSTAESGKRVSDFAVGDKGNNMEISNCRRCVFKNFNFDWDWKKDPLASIVEVAGIHIEGEKSYVDFRFTDYKDFPNKKSRMINISAWDAENRCVGREDGFSVYMDSQSGKSIAPDKEWIAPNVVRIHYNPKVRFADWRVFNKLKVGTFWRMQHYYYHMGAINMGKNEHISLKNINIYSAAGHGIHVGGLQKFWEMENVNIRVPDYDPYRPMSVSADHMHIGASRGFFKMQNCEFGMGADDCINMHDCSGFAVRDTDNCIITKNAGVVGRYFNVGDPLELRNSDYSPTGFTAKIQKIEPVNPARGVYKIFFAERVPAQTTKGFVMFDRLYDTRNIIIDKCQFYGNRARGLLILASDVTVKNCRFYHHEFGAIKLETGYTFDRWSEGYCVNNVVVKNCVFKNVDSNMHINTEGISATEINFKASDGPTFVNRDIYIAAYLEDDPSVVTTDYPVISDVLFENNRFADTFGFVANMSSCGNIIFKDNTFTAQTRRLCNLGYRGCFNVRNAKDVKIINNMFVENPLMKPGVYYNPANVRGLLVEGNNIVENKPMSKSTDAN